MSKINFISYEKEWNMPEVAKPYPAKKHVPDWFKDLPNDNYENEIGTIKNCIPFIDAMTTGYIIPVPETIIIKPIDKHNIGIGGPGKDFVKSHSARQTENSPFGNAYTMKILNPFMIKTEKGVSCLFTAPINKPAPMPINVISSVVDTDMYDSIVHFPISVFFSDVDDDPFILEKGTPLVQVVPFRRESFEMEITNVKSHHLKKHKKATDQKSQDTKYYQKKIAQKKTYI